MKLFTLLTFIFSLSCLASESLMDLVSQNRKWEIKPGLNAQDCPSPLMVENEVNALHAQDLPHGDVSLAFKTVQGTRTSYAMFPGAGGEPVRFTFRESVRGRRQITYDEQNPLRRVEGVGFMSSRHQSHMTNRSDSIVFENTTRARMNLETFVSRETINYNKRTNELNITISHPGTPNTSCSYQLTAEVIMGAEVIDGDRHLVGEDREGSGASTTVPSSPRANGY